MPPTEIAAMTKSASRSDSRWSSEPLTRSGLDSDSISFSASFTIVLEATGVDVHERQL